MNPRTLSGKMRTWIGFALLVVALHAGVPMTAFAAREDVDHMEKVREILVFLERGRPRDLYLARKRGQALVRKYHECDECLRVLARALKRSGMFSESARYWRRLLERKPEDFEALLALADWRTADGMRYLKMESGPISLSRFGKQDIESALEYLERLRATPDGREVALLRLGELALILENWPDVVRYAAPIADPSFIARARALEGTALTRQGDLEAAKDEFSLFLEVASDSMRQLYNDPIAFFSSRHLLLDGDVDSLVADPAAWGDKDPRLLTELNERLLEHYARVTMASVRCATKPGAWDGWRTQPGVLMIRYGEPLAERRVRPEMGADGRVVYEKLQYQYAQTMVSFEDPTLMGRFQLGGAFSDDPFAYAEVARQIDRTREIYDPHMGRAPLEISVGLWTIPRGDQSLLVAAADIPRGELRFTAQSHGEPQALVRLATRVAERGKEAGELISSEHLLQPGDARGCITSPSLSLSFLDTLSPGIWHLSMELEDGVSERWARIDTTLHLFAKEGKPPFLFGPIPCWKGISPTPPKSLLEHSGLRPTSLPVAAGRGTVVMYFEVQGLARDRWNHHYCDLSYSVQRVVSRSWLGRLFHRSDAPAVTANIETQGFGSSLISHFELELEKASAGTYELFLQCFDALTGRSAHGRLELEVCGEEEGGGEGGN